jgi:hypothetical protein
MRVFEARFNQPLYCAHQDHEIPIELNNLNYETVVWIGLFAMKAIEKIHSDEKHSDVQRMPFCQPLCFV